MDYNFRIYTTREEFAIAIAQTIRDIDYEKFKPTAEREQEDGEATWKPYRIWEQGKGSRDPLPEEIEVGNTKTGRWTRPLLYADGEAYHTALNSIWSTVTALGRPGGSWGAYSATNPNGYKSSKEYAKKYGTEDGYDGLSEFLDDEPMWRTGDSFRRANSSGGRRRDNEWWESNLEDLYGDGDYVPQREQDVQDIIDTMNGIPTDQWEDFLSEWEYEMVKPYIADVDRERNRGERSEGKQERRAGSRQQRRENRRADRKARNRERRAAERSSSTTSHGQKALTTDPAEIVQNRKANTPPEGVAEGTY